MSRWVVRSKRADFEQIAKELEVDKVVARILVNRGLETLEDMKLFLKPDLKAQQADPRLFSGMERAVGLLLEAISEGRKIRVIGDYDVDGIMSTYILYTAIKDCGGTVDYAIPRRIEDGYGVNPEMVKSAYEAGVEFIITCDNGIAATEAVEAAKELNMTVVVTDHHDIPFESNGDEKVYKLPKADAIVNPKLPGDAYPFKGICGAQVAMKLATVLYEECGVDQDKSEELVPFAAMACVCDIMELKGENRALVTEGLKAMSNTCHTGLKALITTTELGGRQITTHDLGFVLGPCLNATGRLDSAARALELLLESKQDKALGIAEELVELNEQRKDMTLKGFETAVKTVEDEGLASDTVLVLFLPKLHESLAGIVAGRIKERYYRPTIVLTRSENGVKGSARSIEEYNMYEKLTEVKDIFSKYGGHPMAAGMSLP
ncbi:MAG: single-stranded-DNA-specific exonuclease RecJ, partial [Bacteroidaceae bacterium]|nr:single-stranded-DNA-specific exonuclease RecJ [Bacteroidaceae bacterium]